MRHGAGFRLLCALAGGVAFGPAASAAAAIGAAPAPAGLSAPAPRSVPGRIATRPERAVLPDHHHRRHGIHGYGYGGYGVYDGRSYPQVTVVLPQEAEEPKQDAVPTVIGIQRPPPADPVIYRIEGRRGRQVARVIRLGVEGASPSTGAPHIVPVARR